MASVASVLVDGGERLVVQVIDTNDRKRTESQLALGAAITERMGPGVALIRAADAVIVYTNDAFSRMLGYDPGELDGRPISIVNAPTDRTPEEIAQEIIETIDHAGLWSGRIENLKKDGSSCWCRASVTPLDHPDHGPVWVAVHSDITDVKRSEDELREVREHFEQAFERAPIGMALVNLDGGFMRVNPALCAITGYDADQLVATTFQAITHPDDLDADLGYARQLLAGEIRQYQIEKRYIKPDGNHVWINLSGTLVRDPSGQPDHFIAQVQDISDRKRLETRLRNLADHDSLTGLRNRRVFEEAVVIQVGRCQRYGEHAALLMIDLDEFKAINDTQGHRAGDRTLTAVAHAITQRIRSSDIAARLGGDEFAVLLPHIDAHLATIVAQQIQQAIAAVTIHDGNVEIRVGASIGLALIDEQTTDDQTVLSEADRAMYRAKAQSPELLARAFGPRPIIALPLRGKRVRTLQLHW
jgi:diguanylate cyclase (GGDEF)-like protein/PAS domain S-box-containing protein